jgi:hypothetical protein
MKKTILSFLSLLLFAACEDPKKLPEGYEIVRSDNRHHFVFISDTDLLGNKVSQRETARKICKVIFEQLDYCEVFYFKNKSDIPTQFPIMNRVNALGTYELKGQEEKFRVLN